MENQLEQFEQFMLSHNGWTLVNKTDRLLSYQKIIVAQKGSCLVAAILLLFGLLPGILYLYFTSRPSRTHQLSVTLNKDNTITPSGDDEGMRIYGQFLRKLKNTK